jgi:hypothetical protein
VSRKIEAENAGWAGGNKCSFMVLTAINKYLKIFFETQETQLFGM